MSGRAFGEPRTEADWIAAARELLDRGQAFAAHDTASMGLEQFPDSIALEHALALALVRTGSLERARATLERMVGRGRPADGELARLASLLRAPAEALSTGGDVDLDDLGAAVDELSRMLRHAVAGEAIDQETFGLLGRVYKDLWRRDPSRREWLERSRDTYLRGYRLTGGVYTGINAATTAWISGDRDQAGALAAELAEALAAAPADDRDYWYHATRGEASLLLGREAEAIGAYRRAAAIAGQRHALIVSSYQQLKLLAEAGFAIPAELLELLAPPTLVMFCGHLLDRPGAAPRFPAAAEAEVRARVSEAIEAVDARIGYTSAGCGSDILFIEAMKERGAEVHVVMPFAARDFIDTSVAYAGARWVARFERALRDADSVKYVTREPYLGDAQLFEFSNRVMRGLVELRARPLSTEPHLIAVWDGQPARGPGGTGETIAAWPEPTRVQVIDIADLGRGATPSSGGEPAGSREVRALLFADVVGYSKLDEQDTPLFMRELLADTAAELERLDIAPPLLNTWGDAVFAVLETAADAADYASALIRAIEGRDWRERGLSSDLSVRVALHAGPVFVAADPLTGRVNCYGSHVNRAARLEPITQPGAIYCTEQFAALLATEELVAATPRYALDYVGVHALAKRFGSEPVYRLRSVS